MYFEGNLNLTSDVEGSGGSSSTKVSTLCPHDVPTHLPDSNVCLSVRFGLHWVQRDFGLTLGVVVRPGVQEPYEDSDSLVYYPL